MIKTCASSRANFNVFPINLGVSAGAGAIEKEAMKLLDMFHRSITMAKHYEETLKTIGEAIINNSEENWDGYGAQPVDAAASHNAICFSRLLPINIPVPEIYVDPAGEITFEWYLAPRRVFSVTARRNKELAYAGLFGVNNTHGIEHLYDEVPETILNNILRVLSE
jgi:hypothetical protein